MRRVINNLKGETMKKTILMFVFLFLSCTAWGQTPINPYDLNFNLNTDGITAGYEVMWYAGTDTVMTDSLQFESLHYYSHDSLSAIYSNIAILVDIYPSEKNGENLIAACRAIGTNNRNSVWAYSPYYIKADERRPGIPAFPFISE